MQLARRGFLRLISALPALAVFRSLPVQAAPVSEAPAFHPSQTGIITDIQEPCACALSFSGKALICDRHSRELDGPVVDSWVFGGRRFAITERSVYDMGPA